MNHIFYWQPDAAESGEDNFLSIQMNLIPDNEKYTLWLPESRRGALENTERLCLRFFQPGSCATILKFIIKEAAREHGKLHILDNRTTLYPGTFSNLSDAIEKDPLTIVAVPRSNDNGIGTVQGLEEFSCEEFEVAMMALKKHLRSRIYVPILFASCVCIKTDLFVETGIVEFLEELKQFPLDMILEALYQKVNDYGFNAVLVNDAFVYKNNEGKQTGLHESLDLLLPWFPGHGKMVARWCDSEEYRSEKILSGLVTGKGEYSILLDFSNFGLSYNGTSLAGIQFLTQAVISWPDRYTFHVMISKEAFSFYELDTLPRVIQVDDADGDGIYTACIRFGQPFSWFSVYNIICKAPVLGIFMYDCIAADSNYLSRSFERQIWKYIFRFADVVYCISDFTRNRIIERFSCDKDTSLAITRLSMDVNNYGRICDDKEDYIFILGNDLKHKFARETAIEISKALPNQKIVVSVNVDGKNNLVKSIRSGSISMHEFDGIYKKAKCVIYPSLYEGFGLPVFQAIGSGTVIYLRDSELNRELYPYIQYNNNVVLYKDTKDLIEKLKGGIPDFVKRGNIYAENKGSIRFVNEVLDYLEEAIADITHEKVMDRLLWFPEDKIKKEYGTFKYWKYRVLRKITFGKVRERYNVKFSKLKNIKDAI